MDKTYEHYFPGVTLAIRRQAVSDGIVGLVARRTSFTSATVSRTFAGRFKRPNPIIVAELLRALRQLRSAEIVALRSAEVAA